MPEIRKFTSKKIPNGKSVKMASTFLDLMFQDVCNQFWFEVFNIGRNSVTINHCTVIENIQSTFQIKNLGELPSQSAFSPSATALTFYQVIDPVHSI